MAAVTIAGYTAGLVALGSWLPLLPMLILQGMVFGGAYLIFVWRSDWLTERERLALTIRLRRLAGPFVTADAR
jgi:hypothetical protein